MDNQVAEFSVRKKVKEPGEARRKFFLACVELMETSRKYSSHVLKARLDGIDDPEAIVYQALARFSWSLLPLVPDLLIKKAVENLRQLPESFIASICWGARDYKLDVTDVVSSLRELTVSSTYTPTREFQDEFDPGRMRTWLAEGGSMNTSCLVVACHFGSIDPLRHAQLTLGHKDHPMSALTKADPEATASEEEIQSMLTNVEKKADVIKGFPLVQQRRFCWAPRGIPGLADVLASSEFGN